MNSKIIIFTGPTISAAEAGKILDAEYLPPVSQGDVIKAVKTGPSVIGIIDGYFRDVPTVWHKEILWAMSKGIYVYGCASMGALRAAELDGFGMRGVGWVYENFKNGVLTDDDEVAILHGQKELNFEPVSEAMVNIRQTFRNAADNEIVDNQTAQSLINLSKKTFYQDRIYENIMKLAVESGLLSQKQNIQLEVWLKDNQINQKKDDAVAMLCEIHKSKNNFKNSLQVDFHFEHTIFWDEALSSAGDI